MNRKSFLLAGSAASLLIVLPTVPAAAQAAKNPEYLDFNYGDKKGGDEWVQSIDIKSPPLRSDVKGSVEVKFQAPGMTVAKALCWQQPSAANTNPWGHDATVMPETRLDAEGNCAFSFPADNFPNGPITIRILVHNDANKRDIRELQLFNISGVVWNQGMPKTDPPAARGMKLAFADDFDKPLSISKDGQGATYCAHKPGGGDFSGWPFSDPEGPQNPFSQRGTFLRIHASKEPGTKGSTGLLSPFKLDGTGFTAKAPCYFECRLTCQSAPGTWPAFWTLTKGDWNEKKAPCDELDIIEAYGGVGRGNPNSPGYSVTSHFWNQQLPPGPDGKPGKRPYPTSRNVPMMDLGGKSYWSSTFHTYGVKITKTDTIYYFDDIEVLRHPSGEPSKTLPTFFLINYAIGGISGWKIDLAREGNATDMYVDYVRVYQGAN